MRRPTFAFPRGWKLPGRLHGSNILIFTIHKAASMFLHRLTSQVCQDLRIDYYSENNPEHAPVIQRDGWGAYLEREGCFGPLREYIAVPHMASCSVLLHIRDPRDVLTSLYYSSIYSHTRSPKGWNPPDERLQQWERDGVDQFVVSSIKQYRSRYIGYLKHLTNRENVKVIKYEDMVYNYEKWLFDFLSVFKHTFRSQRHFNKILAKYHQKYKDEFVVDCEDIYNHKRQVEPGDHKRKLKPENITILNEGFKEVLDYFQY